MRPGRFDRRVPVDLPDKEGRVAILKVHCRDKPLGGEVDLDQVAQRTTGFSGAMLQNLMNEAAIYAVRSDRDTIAADDVDSALDRLTADLGVRRCDSSPSHDDVGGLFSDFEAVPRRSPKSPSRRARGEAGFQQVVLAAAHANRLPPFDG